MAHFYISFEFIFQKRPISFLHEGHNLSATGPLFQLTYLQNIY